MNAFGSMLAGPWNWNPLVLGGCALATFGLAVKYGGRVRWGWWAATVAVVLLALVSPLDALASGVLFSAHMTQHILLLLIAPALVLLALPRDLRSGGARRGRWPAVLGWTAGIGAMWFWHVPALCDAAAMNGAVRAMQTLSLLGAGFLFWSPILFPDERRRLGPAAGIVYLFTACVACTALGILLTLTPVEVCPAFGPGAAHAARWTALREVVGFERDRQIGGLLMWVPMCSVYVAAILFELNRWFGGQRAVEEKVP
jgi:Predicted membrane protein